MTIIIGTTLPTMAMGDIDAWSSWLKNAEEQIAHGNALGHTVKHFVAIQFDGRGLEPFQPLLDRLVELDGDHWTYSLDDGRTKNTMRNRLRHITAGQNLVFDYCQTMLSATHLLFLAADCAAPPDILPRMLEMNHPLCAPYISTYGLRGTPVDSYPFPVEMGMASAAAIFIGRPVFNRIRWRWDLENRMSDDPCLHADARELLGVETLVRMDVMAQHYPENVGDYKSRGYDTTVVR